MPVLVDYNQVFISGLMKQPSLMKEGVQIDLVRHIVLNQIRMYRTKYIKEYGELVICCDNRNYWRKSVFPFYKGNRKKMRETSDYDWNGIFEGLNQVKSELYENFPYKVIEVCTCEADDIIAIIVSHFPASPTLILSGDKDFMQLQKFDHVKQYSPMQKKFLQCDQPEQKLREHILRGDKSDGIPNILSDDDSIVNEDKRQSPLTRVKVETWLNQQPIQLEDQTLQEHYDRNEKLVDLTKVPDDLTNQIKDAYDNSMPNGREKLFGYMIKHRLKNLIEHIEEF
tara:strand:+ start:1142 stop:1990 length:849 start_codon:yes stop_codon:yes gene_type:complete